MELVEQLITRAKANRQRIVLPEGTEERTLKAANQILTDEVADLILIGNPAEIAEKAMQWGLGNISKATIINPENHPRQEEYAQLLFQLRQKKGMTIEQARELVKNPLYLGCLIIKNGDADGQLAGARNTTGDVLRPALQIIKTSPGITCVSGAMLLLTHAPECGDNGVLVMGDVAVTPVPDANQLAQIAVCTARTAQAVAGITPRVAMLSFSTKGSAKHEVVDKVVEAFNIAKEMDPNLLIDGELQIGSALNKEMRDNMYPFNKLYGEDVNTLVFPNLTSARSSYKMLQAMNSDVEIIGPIQMGLNKPIHFIDFGSSVREVVNITAVAVIDAYVDKVKGRITAQMK